MDRKALHHLFVKPIESWMGWIRLNFRPAGLCVQLYFVFKEAVERKRNLMEVDNYDWIAFLLE